MEVTAIHRMDMTITDIKCMDIEINEDILMKEKEAMLMLRHRFLF
ncbi:hypothetical protein [Paenibacillus hunanensis]|nr:hypothetical protein [Paenibacillus hunanensis]